MALVSATTAKEYIPELSGTSQDATITSIIARVEAEFARLLGFPMNASGVYTLDAGNYVLYLDGPMFSDADVLSLPIRPLVTVASVYSDVDRVYGSDRLIDAAEYELDLELGRIILKPNTATQVFDRGFRALKVTCNGGYSTSTPPADLVHAICMQVTLIFRNRPNIGVETINQRQASIKVLPIRIGEDVREILRPLRNAYLIL